jgi:hypothetical protein
MLGWALWIGAGLLFEAYTLWWNKSHPGRRANLSAYVSAFFGAGDRRLRYHAGAAVLIATFVFFAGHFLGWWGQ